MLIFYSHLEMESEAALDALLLGKKLFSPSLSFYRPLISQLATLITS